MDIVNEWNKIIAGNKAIAEFMGHRIEGNWVCLKDPNPYDGKFHVSVLSYHSKWDSLMPVIKRFNEIDPVPDFSKWMEWLDTINSALEQHYDINDVYPYVVEAINWYTNQLKQNQ